MPAKVLQVADIPRTKSGKIVELAVRNGNWAPVKNQEALANPEALAHFRDRAELLGLRRIGDMLMNPKVGCCW